MSTEEIHDAGLVENGKPALAPVIVSLMYPVEHDGKVYTEVTIRRVSAQQMSDFINELQNDIRENNVTGRLTAPPMIDVSSEVFGLIDDDDMFKIEEVMRPFTPRRLLAMADSLPADGENTPV